MENNLYLAHYGIRGMKWGKRRYQNKDGSLTPAGEKRYGHADYRRAHDGKSVKYMSDKELMEKNRRLQMEKQYADLTRKKSRGKKALDTFIATAGTIAAVTAAYGTYKKTGQAALNMICNMRVN